MLTRYDGPTFVNPCEVELGDPDFGYCPDNYEISNGQIKDIFVSPLERDEAGVYTPAATPTDYTDLSTYGDIVKLEGFGSKALSDEAETEFPDGMSYITDRTHNLVFEITDSKNENLEVIRALQSGAPVAIWYHTVGGKSFGGNDGIQAQTVATGIVHETGDTPLSGQVTFRWKNKFDPEFDDTAEPDDGGTQPFSLKKKAEPKSKPEKLAEA